jgi:hypothetical protein
MTLLELIFGEEANPFPLLFIVPFGIEIEGQERIRARFNTSQFFYLTPHIHMKLHSNINKIL